MVSHPRVDRASELLEELAELFLAEGFRAFTLADLAARLGCSKTTLYQLGASKEQLTVGVVVHFFRRATLVVEARTAAADQPADRIVAYLRSVADALRVASPEFMTDLAEHPATRGVYERNTLAAAVRVAELIAEGTTAGAFREVHGAFVADAVAAAMQRIQIGAVAAVTGLSDAEAYDELAELVLNGICR